MLWMNVSFEMTVITRTFQIIRTVSYTMVYICIYIIIVTLMRNCIVSDEMAKEMHEEETLSTNSVLSHSKFCYKGMNIIGTMIINQRRVVSYNIIDANIIIRLTNVNLN